MERIYSKVVTSLLLHTVFRSKDFTNGRTNIISEDEFIQCSALHFDEGQTFKPHRHIMQPRMHGHYIPQEGWIVIRGSVKCTFYDIDNTVIGEPILYAGDASFTLNGGHTYTILEDDSMIYEIKTGPYLGQEKDKVFI